MVAYSFMPLFAAPILAGTKAQTIRRPRKRHARSGEEVQLYTGMRTKHCKLIGRATCLFALPVRIEFVPYTRDRVELDGIVMSTPVRLDLFAKLDGFKNWYELRAFWKEHHANVDIFEGVVIRWGPLE